jgi:hypothetical protein
MGASPEVRVFISSKTGFKGVDFFIVCVCLSILLSRKGYQPLGLNNDLECYNSGSKGSNRPTEREREQGKAGREKGTRISAVSTPLYVTLL